MKEKIYLLAVVGTILAVFMTLFFANQESAFSQQCRIIRMYSGTEADLDKIRLEPKTLWIDREGCVIWVNWAGKNEVSIRFSEGGKCKATTATAKLFKLDDQNCYVSTYVPHGGTVSLTFKETGIYEYVTDSKGMGSAKGQIVVR